MNLKGLSKVIAYDGVSLLAGAVRLVELLVHLVLSADGGVKVALARARLRVEIRVRPWALVGILIALARALTLIKARLGGWAACGDQRADTRTALLYEHKVLLAIVLVGTNALTQGWVEVRSSCWAS